MEYFVLGSEWQAATWQAWRSPHGPSDIIMTSAKFFAIRLKVDNGEV